jgi:DNA repair protein RadA
VAEETVGENAPNMEAPAETKTEKKKSRYKEIEDLPGIGSTTATKLRDAGYDSIETIAYAMPVELKEIGGVGEGTAAKVINLCRQAMDMGFETARDVMKRREKVKRITTSSKELDALLGGGVETQSITECYGKFGSSKTQIGFQLCVNAQRSEEEGGVNGGVLFIDTEGTFRPDRIIQIAEAHGMDPLKVLDNIQVARATNSDHQMLLAEKAEALIKEGKIRLIIVDSLTAAFRSDYLGRGTLAIRQQKLNKHMHLLLRYADRYNVAVYITNQVMDRPDIMFGDPTAPIGGHVLAHISTYRIYLRRSKEDRRIARLVDSPNLPDGECVFRVTMEGIRD